MMNYILILLAASQLIAEDGIKISKQVIVDGGVNIQIYVSKKIDTEDFFAVSLPLTKVRIANGDAFRDVEPQKLKPNNSQVLFSTDEDKFLKFYVPLDMPRGDRIVAIDLAWLILSKNDYIKSSIEGIQYPYTLSNITP